MTFELHVDPAAPRAAAAALAAALPVVRALDDVDLAAIATLPGGPALVAEHDWLVAAVGRRLRELAEVADGLAAAADGAAAAEQQAFASIRAVGW